MKKTELISTVAEKCEVKKQDAEKIINAVLDTIVAVSYTHLDVYKRQV